LVKDNWQARLVDPIVAAGDKSSDTFGNVKDWIFDRYVHLYSNNTAIANFLQLDGQYPQVFLGPQ
jgi:hypothetical protein